MRINVYNEELIGDVEVVSTTPNTGRTFYGARVFLASAPELHNDPGDDDRSAITFWTGDRLAADVLAAALSRLTSAKIARGARARGLA